MSGPKKISRPKIPMKKNFSKEKINGKKFSGPKTQMNTREMNNEKVYLVDN